jgi:hypothetical protein
VSEQETMAAIDALPNSGPVQISNTGYSMVLTDASKPRGARAYRHSLTAYPPFPYRNGANLRG